MTANDIPATAPNDAIMAKPFEIRQLKDWAETAFGQPTPGALKITLVRQDYSILRFGRSVMDTPIKIGNKTFKNGIGTHANSEILVSLPADAKSFDAFCGIDNNFNTGGQRGSVIFSVEVDGKGQ